MWGRTEEAAHEMHYAQDKEFGLSEMCFFCDAYRDPALQDHHVHLY